jgi:hypothetical protein
MILSHILVADMNVYLVFSTINLVTLMLHLVGIELCDVVALCS